MGQDVRGVHQVFQLRQVVARGGPRDLHLLGLGRIVQLDQEHEAIELRLGQRIGAFLFDRVLRG